MVSRCCGHRVGSILSLASLRPEGTRIVVRTPPKVRLQGPVLCRIGVSRASRTLGGIEQANVSMLAAVYAGTSTKKSPSRSGPASILIILCMPWAVGAALHCELRSVQEPQSPSSPILDSY